MDEDSQYGGAKRRRYTRQRKYVRIPKEKKVVRRHKEKKVVRRPKEEEEEEKKKLVRRKKKEPHEVAQPQVPAMMMPPPPPNPLDQAIADVKESMTDMAKSKLLYARKRRLNELQAAQFPTGGAPYSGNVPTRPGMTQQQLAPTIQPLTNHAPGTLGAMATAAGAKPSEEIYSTPSPAPRDSDLTNEFLERTLQSVHDDRVREIGFKLLDHERLEMLQTTDPDKMVLKNKETDEAVHLTETELIEAVTFFASSKSAEEMTETTRQFLKTLTTKDQRVRFTAEETTMDPGDATEAFGASLTDGMTDEQHEAYQRNVVEQKVLDELRDEIEPGRTSKRKQTWKEWLMRRPVNPDEVPSIDHVVAHVPSESKEAAKAVLRDMKQLGVIDWDAEGQMIDPQRGNTKMINTDITNVVKHVYTPDAEETRRHLSQYSPTGINFFVERMIKVLAMRNRDGDSPLKKVIAASPGGMVKILRVSQGKTYSLVKMFFLFSKWFLKLGNITNAIAVFVSVFAYMTDLEFATLAKIYQTATMLGHGNPFADVVYRSVAGVADTVANAVNMSPENKATISGVAIRGGDYLGSSMFNWLYNGVTNILAAAAGLFTLNLLRKVR